ncbi:MAG TPA: hypothetical protein VLC95_08855 [Anaerolineae bacterium]|nr:hypothetical protein [Anaerolineae bacterium]
MSQRTFLQGQRPVPAQEIEITGVGLNPLDRRRVDVAVDLTPFLEPVRVEMAIVAPDDEELCSTTIVHNRDWMIDKMLHLRRDAGAGEHVLHVGVFVEDELVAHVARSFSFPPAKEL